MSDTELLVSYVSNFVDSIYSDYLGIRINTDTRMDSVISDIRKKLTGRVSEDIYASDHYSVSYFSFSKWMLSKVIYRFDKEFYNILVGTEDSPVSCKSFYHLPFSSFYIELLLFVLIPWKI